MVLSIVNEDDYREAIKRLLELCDCPKNDDEENELFVLMDMMERYERENCSGS